jgi:hypothetical protein
MLLQRAFNIFLYLHIASIAIALSLNRSFGDGHLPSLHNPREEMQTINEDGTYPPGYIHKYITLGEGINAVTVPVVEAELPDIEEGVQSRSVATPGNCKTYTPRRGICFIIYCWIDNTGDVQSGYIAIMPGKNHKTPRASDPIEMVSSNMNTISLSYNYNTGKNHWFAKGHACSNSDTLTYTNHYLSDSVTGVAYVDHLECDSCIFQDFGCVRGTGFSSGSQAVAWSSSSAVEYNCILN